MGRHSDKKTSGNVIRSKFLHKLRQWPAILYLFCSLPQEEYEKDEVAVPLSSHRSSSRRTAASLLSCLRKQKSDQDPLMRRIALPLRMAQAQVSYAACTSSVYVAREITLINGCCSRNIVPLACSTVLLYYKC